MVNFARESQDNLLVTLRTCICQFQLFGICLPSVYMTLLNVTRSPRLLPSIFTHWKRSTLEVVKAWEGNIVTLSLSAYIIMWYGLDVAFSPGSTFPKRSYVHSQILCSENALCAEFSLNGLQRSFCTTLLKYYFSDVAVSFLQWKRRVAFIPSQTRLHEGVANWFAKEACW